MSKLDSLLIYHCFCSLPIGNVTHNIKEQINPSEKSFITSSDIQKVSRIASHISSPNHFHIPKHEICDKNKMMPYRNGRIGRNDEKIDTSNNEENGFQNTTRKLISDKTNRNNSSFDYRSYMKSILAQPRQESSIFNDEFIKH